VNTFRVLFNSLFDTGLTLLPDESYLDGDEPVQETSPACLP
jgi:hypothetical protein